MVVKLLFSPPSVAPSSRASCCGCRCGSTASRRASTSAGASSKSAGRASTRSARSPTSTSSAWYQVDVVFTLQQFLCLGCVYLFGRPELTFQYAAVVGGLILSYAWNAFAVGVIKQVRRFWLVGLPFSLIQPIFYLLPLYPTTRRAAATLLLVGPRRARRHPSGGGAFCRERVPFCPDVPNLFRYIDVWELPITIFAGSSVLVRLWFLFLLRRVEDGLGFGDGSRRAAAEPRVKCTLPSDLEPMIRQKEGAWAAITKLVNGGNVHLQVIDEKPRRAARWRCSAWAAPRRARRASSARTATLRPRRATA